MDKRYFFYAALVILLLPFCYAHVSYSQQIPDDPRNSNVMPNAYSATGGTGAFTGPLANAARTYQWLINANQLTAMVGGNITSFAMRIPTSSVANWPATDVTYTNFDVYIAPSRPPSQRSLTFDSNIVGTKIQVRSGSLLVPANSYTFGSTPNAFGPAITFTTPYAYSGGDLLIELRSSGFSGTSRTNDAILTSTSGYATNFSACWTGSYTGVTGSQGNFCVIQLNDDITPVELSSFVSSTIKNNVTLRWTTETETNNAGFDIERKSVLQNQQDNWVKIGNVTGCGNSNEQKNYSYYDNGLQTGKYSYRLKQIDYNGTYEYFTLTNEVEIGLPGEFRLSQNYPNPFNPVTKIDYEIPYDSKVNLIVYDILGREAAILVNNNTQKAGFYSVEFNSVNLMSGTYFYRITAQNGSKDFVTTKTMVLIK
ncbi:MAG: T9SS type A sorting domain-containing protein [Bacteroidetes bacterium]|nr:T9SS type A sorting domain-containing protein [Bacteroidota bacterium]